ncbi:uncharacterized protein LOC130086034 [Rhinichthys klamathensis goyatoka]|uniref:uncharacterized protein LOC130086034 n=1 Tax=Rhinichthys klamathensis goyatoka TaxID=3034132 RepID=UPI0024B5B5D5|nr:uncharacterized protein LOC130086034 [Rhinichthys klamathensis goyatoka]
MEENQLGFFQELLPSAERTALLYHLSYLCLAKFPKLERVLRECALETQNLFASSEALLQKCVDTSDQMVSTLFPRLKLAVENNENIQATSSLEKARDWIAEIVNRVEEMVDRYEKHNRSVASCTSDVILEKTKTEKQNAQTSMEIEALEKVVRDLQMELRKTLEEIGQIESKINQCHGRFGRRRMFGFIFLAVVVPFVGHILKSIFQAKPAQNQALANEKARLAAQKSNLKSKEHNIQVRLTDVQLKLANKKTEKGSIPETVRLGDVQKYLYQIQQTLLKHNMLWKSVLVFLESLKSETFSNEHFIEENELKEIVLMHIDSAKENWKVFGESCLTAKRAFSLQNKDAYKFLEFNPSSLSPEEWKRRYDVVKADLTKIGSAIAGAH